MLPLSETNREQDLIQQDQYIRLQQLLHNQAQRIYYKWLRNAAMAGAFSMQPSVMGG